MSDFIDFQTVAAPVFRDLAPLPFRVCSMGVNHFKSGVVSNLKRRNRVQFIYNLYGSGVLRSKRGDFEIPLDKFGVVFSEQGYRYVTQDESWKLMWFSMEGPLIQSIVQQLGFKSYHSYSCEEYPDELFWKLFDVMKAYSKLAEVRASALAYEIMLELSAQQNFDKASGGGVRHLVSRCLNLIAENWSQSELDVNRLAKSLSVNRSVLSRAFKKRQGVSLRDYISTYRVQRMIEHLQSTREPIAACAANFGFADVNAVNRAFKKVTGMTAKKYTEVGLEQAY